ncbi:MAG TPA: uroporphyrinogen-III synthase [Cycloclasticus sp.]|jgi:uroporphyrinogen-III synthase|nr:uroporphyrinogen-III synthase [Cycloclasticus sp.]HIL91900.1 uroporphyrinogen-III synthase [Cycloclasticus sp.]
MAVPTNNAPLINVLVTRPSHQADKLCAELTANGLHAIRYPSIDIQAVSNTPQATAALQNIIRSDNLIFISANAVTHAHQLLSTQWPEINGSIIAIGPSTANALLNIGLIPRITAQTPFNSEQLLKQLPSLDNVSIIKGEGGRDFLEKQLTARGINVTAVDVYKRAMPANNPIAPSNVLHYITITSQLALENLFLLLPAQTKKLKQASTFVVLSQRIAQFAKSLGCQHILTSKDASDAGLVAAITDEESH